MSSFFRKLKENFFLRVLSTYKWGKLNIVNILFRSTSPNPSKNPCPRRPPRRPPRRTMKRIKTLNRVDTRKDGFIGKP